ncbi:MAG TPA: hypothetical protein VHV08_11400, partial [Pirellulales bacterium]|nr:hypothetical protein [Pirellulales bacterium]
SSGAPTVAAVPPLAAVVPSAVASDAGTLPASMSSLRLFLASALSTPAANRWDWLADSVWYVPTANLLAYSMLPDLTHATAVGDQTVWYITSSSEGQIAGYAVAKLSSSSSPSTMTLTGVVTGGGQIHIEFTSGSSQSATTGVGQMRFVNGAWTMEMQMATGSSVLVTHWAYMVEQMPGATPPGPGTQAPNSGFLSNEWNWVLGTHWAITDTNLFGGQTKSGVFEIDGYRNGYFWGSGTSSAPFNVFGSITPEGNLLLLISLDGAPAVGRMGIVQQTSTGARMTFRSYDGPPSVGSAVTLSRPAAVNIRSLFLSS